MQCPVGKLFINNWTVISSKGMFIKFARGQVSISLQANTSQLVGHKITVQLKCFLIQIHSRT